MKVRGRVSQLEVVMLIDSGATHNFISTALVQKLQISLMPTLSYGMVMGTGISVEAQGICKNVVVSFSGLDIVEQFLPFDLGGLDQILGMQWLNTLGPMIVHWKNLTMKFKMGGVRVTLQGDPSLTRALVSLKLMEREVRRQGEVLWVELGSVEMGKGPTEEEIPATLLPVLAKFEDVFSRPGELPPARNH